MANDEGNPKLEGLNLVSREEFVRSLGGVFEHSPWIADVACERRPFKTVEALHQALCAVVADCGEQKQLELICSHPDLVGKAALAGTLTRESTVEQAAAGLNRLTPEEVQQFQEYNMTYRKKFGFPFVICARLNEKKAILDGFATRLGNSREQEIAAALEEIYKIAYLRLSDILATCPPN